MPNQTNTNPIPKPKTVEERLKLCIAQTLGISVVEIETNSSIKEDLGADSLDEVEIILAVEDDFEIEITDDDAEKIITFGDALKLVQTSIEENAQKKESQ